jgi:hypothetical protein
MSNYPIHINKIKIVKREVLIIYTQVELNSLTDELSEEICPEYAYMLHTHRVVAKQRNEGKKIIMSSLAINDRRNTYVDTQTDGRYL